MSSVKSLKDRGYFYGPLSWPWMIAVFCLVYLVARAILIPLTYDEIWTIESLDNKTLLQILTYQKLGSNSHLLNSLSIWLMQHSFSFLQLREPLIYRVPNILGFLLYAWCTIKLISRINFPVLKGIALVFCFLNPFLLEFFSLARGYGMALAFSAAALLYFERYQTSGLGKHFILILVFSALAVLANFSWLNFYLAMMPVLLYLEWMKNKKLSAFFWLRISIPTILLALLIYRPVHQLRVGDELWYGGNTGLVYDTFTSLMLGTMGFQTDDFSAHLVLGAIALLILILFFIQVKNGLKKNDLTGAPLLYLILFTLLCLSSILQHLLFKTPFLVNRVALVYLLPLIWLIIKLDEWGRKWKQWQIGSISTLILALFALFNFFQHTNLSHSYSWPFDAKSELILGFLNEKGEEQKKKIHLDHSWIINSSMQYYSKTNKFPWVELIRNTNDSLRFVLVDYYLLYDNKREYSGYNAYHSIPDSFYRDTVLYYPDQDLLLLQVRK